MIPPPDIKVIDRVSDAIQRLVDSRSNRSGFEKAINLSMERWISFTMAKFKVADKNAIRSRLMGLAEKRKGGSPVRRYNKRGNESNAKRYLALRDTVAAAVVYATNYKGARALTPEKFFGLVGKFIAARMYSSGHHKGGFRPALNEFKVRRGQLGVAPFYRRHIVGRAQAAHEISDSKLEAMVVNNAGGVTKNPTGAGAEVTAKAEVVVYLEKLILQNLLEKGEALGFHLGTIGLSR